MSKEYEKNAALKKEIGWRFKEFREAIKKSQDELANELKVCQGTIANIEKGRFYPKFKMQHYLYGQYHLNLNWLLTGKGEMIISRGKDSKAADFPVLFSHIDEDDPRFEEYMELKSLMSIPVIDKGDRQK
ncbi:MAG: helix-turn-helix transcriptional regulator [Candidatus Aminicenantes bacterium]|nr:MAG: helix-turn-helix transcriptional regulator [Candidatus Aminicenantes bacterium]